jgi:hypothetical protein
MGRNQSGDITVKAILNAQTISALDIMDAFLQVVVARDNSDAVEKAARTLVTHETLNQCVAAATLYVQQPGRKAGDKFIVRLRTAMGRVKVKADDKDQRPFGLTYLEVSNSFVLGRRDVRKTDPDLEVAMRELIHRYGSRQVSAMARALCPLMRPVKKSGPIMRSQSLKAVA